MIEVAVVGSWALIVLTGDFDAANVGEITSVAVELAAQNAPEVTVDLSGVTFIGAAGIGALVGADRLIAAADGRLVLVGASPRMQRIFELAGPRHALRMVAPPGPPATRLVDETTDEVADEVADEALSHLLSEVGRLLLTESTVTRDLQAVVRAAVDLVPGCAAASVAVVARSESYTAAISDEVAVEVDLAQYATGEGPCLLAAATATRIRVATLAGDERFGRFAPLAERLGISSVLSVPVAVGALTVASLNLYSAAQFAPGADAVAEVIAAQVGMALTKSGIYGAAQALAQRVQLRTDADRNIHIAAGVLAGFEQCSLQQAQRLLRSAALSSGDSLSVAARRVIDHLADGGPIHS